MRWRRRCAALVAAVLAVGLSVPPALAAEPVFIPKVTVTPSADLDPAGTAITVKGTGFYPEANGGRGFGLRVGPDKPDVRDRTGTGFQVSRLITKEPKGTQIRLNPDGSWEFTATVKAEYTSLGTTYSAKTTPFSVYVFGWDTPDGAWDRTTPLKFAGIGDPGPEPTGSAGLHWGLKQGWRSYIEKFHGTITPSNGTKLDQDPPAAKPFPYAWPYQKSTWDGQKGTVAFGGRVDYALEPHMIWAFGFADPKVTLAGDGTGTISGTVNYAFYGTKTAPKDVRPPSDVVFGSVKVKGNPRQDKENVVVDFESAKFTDAGAAAFAGFYHAGDDLDLGSLVFPGKAGPPVTTPPTGTPPVTTPAPSAPGPDPACVLTPGSVRKGNLVWGFKKSFRQYVGTGLGGTATGNSITAADGAEITGIDEVAVQGRPNPAGIPTGAYRFGFGTAEYASPGEFTAGFRGTVTFGYPSHFFTLVLRNPKVVVSGGKGTLYADVELKTTTGSPSPPVSKPGVALANLDLATAKKTDGEGTLEVSAIKATLTSSEAFAGFYQAGDVLDEATVTLGAGCSNLPGAGGGASGGQGGGAAGPDLVPEVAFRPGNLASTGATLAPLYWAALLLAAGGTLVLVSRRPRRS
ncbi:HtaA domain-containing protein [Amycolatopsis minnesotensis]|uniref:Htaa domain-containing protein n=1 Tax=Amycolatopsis minnesotensis TaxID=337894 RepID=A0ABN2QA58_9PSEU